MELCVLLFSGAVADVVGAKLVWVTGSFLYVGFTVAVGLSRTEVEIILFRTLLGIAVSMCLPTAVSLVTNTFPKGNWRNVAFATIGMGQPPGFSVGLLLGEIFTDTIGWRWSFFVSAIIKSVIALAAIWSLPSVYRESEKKWTRRLAEDIDWIGALALTAALGILLYVLATATSSYHRLGEPQNIVLLVASVILLGVFLLYMEYQRIQSLSALQSSLRFLPHIIMGVFVNIGTGFLISRVKMRTLAVTSGLVALISGRLMATIDTHQSYWLAAFWAMLLSPVSCDVFFIVANLAVSDAYPADVQSLAGGVLNEVGQFGNTVGLAVTAAIAASVTEHSKRTDSKDALMQGYRASFWAIFTATAAVVGTTFVGLKKGGFVGKKDE
ncbi:MAG: hypothetical protein OHK93_000009 [Ramalina farinacea]|uniref:Major facilitator superfamily (MFS) profile domain-containing protein n=1 Tax=Ramalina farinacea TaxID=258253 RepID=A0AA43TS42_9LECA|nr:hypothetical protein [Ramalina farinacea]